tara:strand:+ start:2105 stop:2737 length:633 start_codon:yes stop_codon:yes gene_type:complete
MKTVRSISGAWMKVVARNAFPYKRPRGRIEALADALQIRSRTCYAYISEERRVPEDIEQRFIALFGPVAEDGYRTVQINYARKRTAYNLQADGKDRVPTKMLRSRREGWREGAMNAVTVLAQDSLGHIIRWKQNPLTIGQLAMLEHALDEEEAMRKYPKNFYTLASDEDWVATCNLCPLIGAIDDRERTVNGLLFRVTCGSESYKITEEE